MEYLDIIKNTGAKIKAMFDELHATWKDELVLKDCPRHFSTTSLLNQYQLLDSILGYYPASSPSDDNGIEISISFVQFISKENSWHEYSSLIRYTENGDLDLGQRLYMTSDICSLNGSILFENEPYEITILNVHQLENDISNCLDKIFSAFKNNKELFLSVLEKIKSR